MTRITIATVLMTAGLIVSGPSSSFAEGALRDLVLAPAQRPVATAAATSSTPLRAGIVASSQAVAIGDSVRLTMAATRNGYGHLYILNASGRTQMLFENKPVTAGRVLVFPGSTLSLKAAAPAGQETLVFVVSMERLPGLRGVMPDSPPAVLGLSHGEFRSRLAEAVAAYGPARVTTAEVGILVR